MIPNIGVLFSIKAILTVNSPFFFINSFVPSKGSTSQYCSHDDLILNGISEFSSESIGISGVSTLSLSHIILFESVSALVNGDKSSLI